MTAGEAHETAEGPLASPGFWLHHAALRWRAELDRRLREIGLTPTQFLLLASAGWAEHTHGAPTQQQVAQTAGADRMMTSKVVKNLEEAGLLSRTPDPSDGRAYRLQLTPAGRRTTRKAIAIAQALDEELFGDAPVVLRTALRRIAKSG
ncbi:DNA-binding MarR family transcriptional regulator [Kribbella aluminosa]|uniref:DNA-binding MarR family transcriptional regulator n=1 Tax=Kribbella aluminosa TaxID=416017 RepID=A0ABS4UUD7_9ACTN|nr:MarR family transcriptional regulator [Kribbella aluminosa]MBP2355231.1 DNA-binding MarR family transcriptional regulator [Kribbella aluminosa]